MPLWLTTEKSDGVGVVGVVMLKPKPPCVSAISIEATHKRRPCFCFVPAKTLHAKVHGRRTETSFHFEGHKTQPMHFTRSFASGSDSSLASFLAVFIVLADSATAAGVRNSAAAAAVLSLSPRLRQPTTKQDNQCLQKCSMTTFPRFVQPLAMVHKERCLAISATSESPSSSQKSAVEVKPSLSMTEARWPAFAMPH